MKHRAVIGLYSVDVGHPSDQGLATSIHKRAEVGRAGGRAGRGDEQIVHAIYGSFFAYARFDAIDLQSTPDVPGNVTANTYNANEDFVLVGANNVRHIFNPDGRLVRVVDASGNSTKLAYTYDYGTTGGPTAYTLTAITGPSNGATNVDGTTAARSISVTGIRTNTVTFTENIGATGDTGRKAIFTTSGTDLVSVSPARNVAGTCTGNPDGCVKFDYTAGTHLLTHLYDPRGDGTTGNGYYEAVTWTSGAPTAVTEGASNTILRILKLEHGHWRHRPARVAERR